MKYEAHYVTLVALMTIFAPASASAQEPTVNVSAAVTCFERRVRDPKAECAPGVEPANLFIWGDSATAEATLDGLVDLVLRSEEKSVRNLALTYIGFAGHETLNPQISVVPRLSRLYWSTSHFDVRRQVIRLIEHQADKRLAVEFLRSVAVDDDPDSGLCSDCPAHRNAAVRLLPRMGEDGLAILDHLVAEGVVRRDSIRRMLYVWSIPVTGPDVGELQVFGDTSVKREITLQTQDIHGRSTDWVNVFTGRNLTDIAGAWATELRGARMGEEFGRVIVTAWNDYGRYTAEYYVRDSALLHVYETFEYFEGAAPGLVWRNFKGIPAWERRTYFTGSEVTYAEARGGWGPQPGEDGEVLRAAARRLTRILEGGLEPAPDGA
jgi:hypothetical protein